LGGASLSAHNGQDSDKRGGNNIVVNFYKRGLKKKEKRREQKPPQGTPAACRHEKSK